jgi:hypothetical protein
VTNKRRAHDEEAWRNAKKVCRLNARQLEMARRLGMNPTKLPRLRPAPRQHWKLPVGEFIEELYSKRFGFDSLDRPRGGGHSGSRNPGSSPWDGGAGVVAARSQLESLVCYLMNLADDVQAWLVHGSIDAEVTREISTELQEIVRALDTGVSISEVPSISLPPRPARPALSRRDDPEDLSDDDIPF